MPVAFDSAGAPGGAPTGPGSEVGRGRGIVALVGLAINLRLAQGDVASLGLVMPRQGWRYWARAALLIGLAVSACILVGLGAWVLSGRELPVYATDPRDLGAAFLRMCVI